MSTQLVAAPGHDAPTSVGGVIELTQLVIEERDAELAELRERLAYYEAFDTLISDNVARSAELFRSLSNERERMRQESTRLQAERELAVAAEAERQLADERAKTHAMLMALMDDASKMQRQIDGLIQRIAEAITTATVR
jgi:chromosome segregation ATPase